MHQELTLRKQREDIDIVFWKTSPEAVLENIRLYGGKFKKYNLTVDAAGYTKKAYRHFSQMNFAEYSPDEVDLRYENLQSLIQNGEDVFGILYKYADNVLMIQGNSPVCKLDKVLNWNSLSSRVGQDIFTTAWLAEKDSKKSSTDLDNQSFVWPAVLKTDDGRLNEMFKKGLAENHFHLNGSTQSFPLSWACLMNHPEYIKKFFKQDKRFEENLSLNISKGVLDNVTDWSTRIYYAALIRALLFKRCLQIINAQEVWKNFREFDKCYNTSVLRKHISALRYGYGAKLNIDGKRRRCLDYAICRQCYSVEEMHYNRLLSGERNFLYQCFYRQFSGQFTLQESSLFYLYLLIKSNFRGELIQNNKRSGFTNFASYQDRKNQFFGNFYEYWNEAQKLAVCAGIEENNMISLEARIMPKRTAQLMDAEIKKEDKIVGYNQLQEKDFYYVIHFGKKKFEAKEFQKRNRLVPRNVVVRKAAQRNARALKEYITRYDVYNQRVWGIDACSLEIGCRPETFATEFRYLRECSTKSIKRCWYKQQKVKHKELGITYHVGEDFLDIADGLRAIDEAIRFLDMRKGDRLGHAIVLGIEAKEYYAYKKGEIYLTKQDFLDNLVWILYRSLELNIVLGGNQRAKMQEKARDLLNEIYGSSMKMSWTGDMLDMYYFSWRIRGDHPDLYKSREYIEVGKMNYDSYKHYMVGDKELDKYRKESVIAELYYLYHYDKKVKLEGLKTEGFAVDDSYIKLMEELQQALRFVVFSKGIAIECNPTSNVLIGTFKSYDKHPILAFNQYKLENNSNPNIQVSINTDDLGVFDTSLENEYALMLNAIIRNRHEHGNYNDDSVYEYLDYLRINGINMAFKNICK